MSGSNHLAGRAAQVNGEGPLAEAISAKLQANGASVGGTAAIQVQVNVVAAPVARSLLEVTGEAYDAAFEGSMGKLYADMQAGAAAIKAAGGGTIVNVFVLGRDAGNHLGQALTDGMESITACFGASFAAPPEPVRVNAVRVGSAATSEERDAVAETVVVLASEQSSYMNGMTVPLLNPVRAIAV